MCLDNGTTKGESYSHTVILGCVERLKESVRSFLAETDSCVLDGQAHTIAFVSLASDRQLSRTIVDGAHRVRRVTHQVRDDLLKLYTIAYDGRQVIGKFRSYNNLTSLEFAQEE